MSTPPATWILTVRYLEKRFGDLCALQGVSFSVRRGEVLGIIGPNGAGKTTLLECLCGLLPANRAEMLFNGECLSAVQRRSAMFYLPDSVIPYPEQTARHTLEFFGRVYKAGRERFRGIIEALQLWPILERRVDQLSRGSRQRLLLAIGLVTPQPILLIDEPFNALDFRQMRDVVPILRGAAAAGRTLVLSIHQLAEAQRICDRFLLLSDGRTIGEGTLPELRTQANTERGDLEDLFLALM